MTVAIKNATIYGVTVGAIAAMGNWEARYVSFLPKLPMKVVGAVGGISFITAYIAEKFILDPTFLKDILSLEARPLLYLSIVLIGGTALVTYTEKTFNDKNISLSQLAKISFMENIAGLIFTRLLCS